MEQLYISVRGQLLEAEVRMEGMKAANDIRKSRNESMAYDEADFIELAGEIRNITDQLFKH